MKYFLVVCMGLASGLSLYGQSSYRLGMIPLVNMTVPLEDKWRLNLRAESRQGLAAGTFSDRLDTDYEYLLTDLSLSAVRDIRLTNSFAFGILMRLEGGMVHWRTSQQYSITTPGNGKRFGHRIATDQTFEESEADSYRLRYRFTVEWALNGYKVDVGEWYFKLGNELLNKFTLDSYDLEYRLVPSLGYKPGARSKLEIGLDYRLDNFIAGSPGHTLWQNLSWYYVL